MKQALLRKRLQLASDQPVRCVEIPKRPNPRTAPLSFAQSQMWVIDQMAPGNPAYNLPYGFRLRGPLDIAALDYGFNEIIKRHETLRTTFAVRDGEPLQLIHPELTIKSKIQALDHLEAEECERKLQALASEESVKPFDLTRLPLIRVSLFKLGEAEHVLIVNLHHIVADGLSVGVLLGELDACYRAFAEGGAPQLPELAVQYGDFAHWQQQTLADETAHARQMEFWRTQLSGTLPVLELPVDKPRPVAQSFNGANVFFDIPAALAQDLKSLGSREDCTFFTTVLAAFQVLLQRYSSAEDIVIGTPVAVRSPAEIEPLIGNFLNMAALRCDVSGDPTFIELLRRSRDTALNAFSNSDLPFEAMMKHLKFERDPSRNPVFQVGLQVLSNVAPRIGDLEVGSFYFDLKFAQFDLTLHLYQEVGGYRGRFEYCADLFDTETIERLARNFSQLLHAIIREPGQRIATLPVLTDAERQQLVGEWSTTAPAYPDRRCLHQVIEQQAERTPDQFAVVFEHQQLTYGELNCRANRLAHHLREAGVGPDMRVGLFVERSWEMVAGILGILKAGAAYVPVDAAYPQERIAFMLADAGVSVVLTQTSLLANLPGGAAHPVCLDAFDWTDADGTPSCELPVAADNLAYVIYTSGSTGRPKGVGVEHRNIVNYALSVAERLQITPGMQHATVSTIAADLGNTVIFSALATGGCLHVLSQERVESPTRLAEYFKRAQIDVLKVVPSHLAALQADIDPEQVMPRRRLILGGEASRLDWIARLRRLSPTCEIYNHYGPTETTVGALTYHVGPTVPGTPSGTLPLGRPLPGYRAYILDPHGQPVPTGVQGELCIGGRGVARGYLNRPDLSVEKFVSDPFSPNPGDRLYRTGDRARYLPDGNIEFRGRVDHQVKVRGYRVELGEIETALREHRGVRDALVLARDDESGTKQLVGYVVPKRAHQPLWYGKKVHVLPDGTSVAHLNKNETDYIYHEIFVLQAYLRHGITIQDGDVIVDAGANIGLFTVFASRLARNLRILAFEPNPAAFACLQANADAWGAAVHCLPVGLSHDSRSAELKFFEGFSLLSGFYADAEMEREVVKTYALNQAAALPDGRQVAVKLDELLEDRFRARTETAQLRTLSSVIAEQGVERIDLLKINVEKSELDVLQGISPADWPKIRQLVIEVDQQIHVAPITALLAEQGYEVLVEQDPLLRKTELCYVYAMRPSATGCSLVRQQPADAHARALFPVDPDVLTPGAMRSHLKQRLPAYMIPSAVVLLDAFPLTSNGKIDRTALAARGVEGADTQAGVVAPRTPTEEMVLGVFRGVLKRTDFGVFDSFFDLGGHSLMAVRIMAQLYAASGHDLPLRVLFERQTVAALAEAIDALQWLRISSTPGCSTAIREEVML